MTEVTIERWPGEYKRGRKKILVDGKHWGSIFMEGHGCHGPHYWFRQEIDGHDGYMLHDPEDLGYKKQPREVRVNPPSKWERHRQGIKADVPSLLLAKAKELVERKLLRDPTTVRLEQDQAHERYLASVKKEEEDRRIRDLNTAWNIIQDHWDPADGVLERDKLADAIADAIAKARSEP